MALRRQEESSRTFTDESSLLQALNEASVAHFSELEGILREFFMHDMDFMAQCFKDVEALLPDGSLHSEQFLLNLTQEVIKRNRETYETHDDVVFIEDVFCARYGSMPDTRKRRSI